jgi:hypothetical protein
MQEKEKICIDLACYNHRIIDRQYKVQDLERLFRDAKILGVI